MDLTQKMNMHASFWRGEGPCLILIPADKNDMYDTVSYRERFFDPEKMWHSEMAKARAYLNWPTDGIPTVRPNLGTVFIPSMAGQTFSVVDGQMPWPGPPLPIEEIVNKSKDDARATLLFQLAERFYAAHRLHSPPGVVPYHPDTQGVFDIGHLLYGDQLFYELSDNPNLVDTLLECSFDLYVRVTKLIKALIGEENHRMIHGHGTPQGIYFPEVGVRVAEDTATLISPAMVDRFIVPYIRKVAGAFNSGIFVHYCGRHKTLFHQLSALDEVKAIDLGNPEMYDTRAIMARCAETGTVLFSRLASLPGENWRDYLDRLIRLVRATGVRCILRPVVYPSSAEECAAMHTIWHEQTA